MGRVDGKVVVITGAGSGIGEAAALLCAREGAKLFLIGRTASKLEGVCSQIQSLGGQASYFAGDLQNPDMVDKAFRKLSTTYEGIDALVNSAAVGSSWEDISPGSMNDIATTPLEKYREIMQLNLDSTYFMCRRAVQLMQPKGAGAIVNISSIYGAFGAPTHHTYGITKAAIMQLTKSMAVAYGPQGIRVNCIIPGFITTPMNASVMHVLEDETYMSTIPLRRPGKAGEVATACLYLISDESSYITGALLPVDGGRLAN